MCAPEDVGNVTAAMPRPAPGPAVDPIALAPVDEVSITTLMDNAYDGLLTDGPGPTGQVTRGGLHLGRVPAAHCVDGYAVSGLRAEHGFAALVTVRVADTEHRLVFDTGLTPDGMVVNADRLQIPLTDVRAVVMSHGHFDHAGGLVGMAGRKGPASLPLVLHPYSWARRRFETPGGEFVFPTMSKKTLIAEGFDVIERRIPSLLLDDAVLITGEVDRATDFERGMPPPHQAWTGDHWEHDPLVIDDQALVVNVRGRGLVVLTGCGHAGVVNIVRHAMRLTGVDRLAALIGGFHLGGQAFEPVIPPTLDELQAWQPQLVVPGHCTGWKAQHALAARLPGAFVPGSSGSTYQVAS